MFVIINLIVTVAAAVAVIFIYNNYYKSGEVKTQNITKFVGLEKELVDMEKDIDFYRNLDKYKYLLNEEDYALLDKELNKAEENKDFENLTIIFYASYLSKQKDIKNLFEKIKNEINIKKIKYTKAEEDDFFNKNNACINLSKSLAEKLSSEEKLDVIFYSPNTKSCLYVVRNKYRVEGAAYNDFKSYGYDTLKVYNSTNQAELEQYIIDYSYNYPNKTEVDTKKETENNKSEFIKYILENSNYNVDLLKDISFIYAY